MELSATFRRIPPRRINSCVSSSAMTFASSVPHRQWQEASRPITTPQTNNAQNRRFSSFSCFGLSEPSEVAVRLPCRLTRRIRNALQNLQHQLVELCRSSKVNRLLRVIRRRMITILQPLSLSLVFG